MTDLVKNTLKKFILNLIYKTKLKNKSKKNFNKFSNINPSICVIVDSRLNIGLKDLDFLNEVFKISDEAITFLWYKSHINRDLPNHFNFVRNDISFSGNVTNSIFNNNYDLLLNLYQKNSVSMKLLSLNVRNNFSIGFTPVDIELNDIVFDFDIQDIKLFRKELIKYLKIITN